MDVNKSERGRSAKQFCLTNWPADSYWTAFRPHFDLLTRSQTVVASTRPFTSFVIKQVSK